MAHVRAHVRVRENERVRGCAKDRVYLTAREIVQLRL